MKSKTKIIPNQKSSAPAFTHALLVPRTLSAYEVGNQTKWGLRGAVLPCPIASQPDGAALMLPHTGQTRSTIVHVRSSTCVMLEAFSAAAGHQ